jgi:DNA-directed RNA polymerase specialized sigma24 family protein
MNPTLDFAVFHRATRRWARLVFAGRHDREELTDDAVSTAWELLQSSPPTVMPSTIARFAVQRVKVDRQFAERQRSITGPNPRRLDKPTRNALVETLTTSNNPAEIVQVRLDFAAWYEQLTGREQQLLLAFLDGERTKDLARRFGISFARVSQIRRELVDHWAAFTA